MQGAVCSLCSKVETKCVEVEVADECVPCLPPITGLTLKCNPYGLWLHIKLNTRQLPKSEAKPSPPSTLADRNRKWSSDKSFTKDGSCHFREFSSHTCSSVHLVIWCYKRRPWLHDWQLWLSCGSLPRSLLCALWLQMTSTAQDGSACIGDILAWFLGGGEVIHLYLHPVLEVCLPEIQQKSNCTCIVLPCSQTN